MPHSSIDTEADWTKSGWHGWIYGWKLHLACTVAGVWIPLGARLTPANVHDGRIAPLLIGELPEEARFVLGDLALPPRRRRTGLGHQPGSESLPQGRMRIYDQSSVN